MGRRFVVTTNGIPLHGAGGFVCYVWLPSLRWRLSKNALTVHSLGAAHLLFRDRSKRVY